MDKTIIDNTGRGVAYASSAGCNALGIAGLCGVGDGIAPVSSSPDFLHLPSRLGLWLFAENEMRPRPPACEVVPALGDP